jgi:hypothetical protein
MATHQLFIDLGMSGTKALMTDGLYMYPYACPPKVADLSPSELATLHHQGHDYGGGIESGAYLQWNTQAFALATDAEGRPNKSTVKLRKSMMAHLRTLGVIGEFAHSHGLSPKNLDLGIALPFDEHLSDAAELTQRLRETKAFTYRGQPYDLKVASIRIVPEAASLVLWRKMRLYQKYRDNTRSFVVVMIGHRDLSFLVFRQGQPPTGKPSETVKLGFVAYLDVVSQNLCKPENPYLVKALFTQQETVQFPDQPGKTFPLKERHQEAVAFYWEQVRHYLSEHFAALDLTDYEVLIGGGTALTLLRPYLAKYLPTIPGATLNWLTDLSQEMVPNLPTAMPEIERVRFADCYSGIKWLSTAMRVPKNVQEVKV